MELWTAFILGLVGSLHCAGMCGPLALALPGSDGNTSTLLAGRAAYNAGRIITYSVIGIIFGLAGRTLLLAGVQRWVSISLGVLLLAGLFGARKLALSRPVTFLVGRLKSRMGTVLRRRSIASLTILGLLNGFLPCGLVYAAAAAAATTAGVWSGAQYMAAFGFGTVPMMLTISLSGKLVPLTWRLTLNKAIPVSVFVLGSLLILRGLSLGIPFLSPDLATGACCHR